MKKYLIFTLIICCIVLSALVIGCSKTAFLYSVDLKDQTIVIDAGHGDTDVGTIGLFTGRFEKDVNLEIALELEKALNEKGATVVMTRSNDDPLGEGLSDDLAIRKEEDMQKREELIQEANPDIFISIHQNAFEDSNVKGPQVFYLKDQSGNIKGKNFASEIQKALNNSLNIEKPRSINFGNLRLLKKGNEASCLIECGFFTNEEEELLLQQQDYQEKIANAIVLGIENYLMYNGI